MKSKTLLPVVMLVFLLSPLFSGIGDNSETFSAEKILNQIETALDTSVTGWQWSEDKSCWKPLKTGKSLKSDHFWLKTAVTIPGIFAGTKISGTPCSAELSFSVRGHADILCSIDGKSVKKFTVDASRGFRKSKKLVIPVSASLAAGRHLIECEVRNSGFYPPRTEFTPPRRTGLKEKGISFSVQSGRMLYPAAVLQEKLQRWLLSMHTVNRLINPQLVRHTFTGKPFAIPDKRRISPKKLRRLKNALKNAVSAFDLEAFSLGNPDTLKKSLEKSYSLSGGLRKYAAQFKVHLIGNSHIDVAWLWRMAETVAVAKNTFTTVIANMDEYPELHYAQSQALIYQWIEKKHPELFAAMREKIRTGRWEITGGMWVEPDCNLISGESWVRQILYGKRYFKQKFNVDVHVGWNVDSFGYNWNMPQIYRKSGIDTFVTQKIWWNDTTVFPHYLFWWQGVDNSRLLSYFPPAGYTSRVKLKKIADQISSYEATTGLKQSLILYGLGDHGGGPNREILDRIRHYNRLSIAPEFVHTRAAPFLNELGRLDADTIPVWNDELYLEYHRGTYTTQGAVKKANRRQETQAGCAEKWSALASLFGFSYPRGHLETAWKKILANQFHDILPGSSITPVYRDAMEEYAAADRLLQLEKNRALRFMANRINTASVKGRPLVIFNSLAWKRTDYVSFPLPAGMGRTVSVVDPAGATVPCETFSDPRSGQMRAGFIARNLPALGYRVYALQAKSAPPARPGDLQAAESTLENRFLRIKINPLTGNLSSVYHKASGRECLAAGQEGNRLQIHEDLPENWDAWNIGYTGRMWELNRADSAELVHVSPVRAVFRVKKSFLGPGKTRREPTEDFPSSFFVQDITLYSGLERADIVCQADWWEDHMFLKAVFPFTVQSRHATYEIPFAAIRRSTLRDTPARKARFEVPALRWADLSEAGFGISLLNNCKYGHDTEGSVMRLSLLRAPTWPDPVADRGRHEFTYSLYPHRSGWEKAATVLRARELNTPLNAIFTSGHDGKLPLEYGFVSLSSPNIVLDSIKIAEDDNALILRLFESSGQPGDVIMRLAVPPRKVVETTLMEIPRRDLDSMGPRIQLSFTGFEIKTLKIYFDSPDTESADNS